MLRQTLPEVNTFFFQQCSSLSKAYRLPFQATSMVLVLAAVALLLVSRTEARNPISLACNPLSANMMCLEGCLTCFETFGGQMYDTAACCRDCQLSHANLLDYGPESCSHKYVRSSWLKRFG